MIDAEMRATIRKLYFNRHLTVNAVAEALGIHHDTVRRAIGTSRMEEVRKDDDYMATYGESKIQDTLEQIFRKDSRHAMPTLFTFADLDSPQRICFVLG